MGITTTTTAAAATTTLLLRQCVLVLFLSAMVPVVVATSGPLKILVLHGGGGSANGFRNSAGMRALSSALPDVEFSFAQGPYGPTNDALWIRDPPGGKGQPTQDVNWASASVNYLNRFVQERGPFDGILGYSQGSAMVPVYLAQGSARFRFVMLFCGYIPSTHQGLVRSIQNAAPFQESSLVWIGEQDTIISPVQTNEQATLFTSPDVIRSRFGDHAVPSASDPTFNQVVAFVRAQRANDGPTASPSRAVAACGTYRNARGCNRAGCRWTRIRGRRRCVIRTTTSPTPNPPPTASPPVRCQSLRRAGKCNRNIACRWLRRRRRCVEDTQNVVTAQPTVAATTREPTPPPTSKNCRSIRIANNCRSRTDCKWFGRTCYDK